MSRDLYDHSSQESEESQARDVFSNCLGIADPGSSRELLEDGDSRNVAQAHCLRNGGVHKLFLFPSRQYSRPSRERIECHETEAQCAQIAEKLKELEAEKAQKQRSLDALTARYERRRDEAALVIEKLADEMSALQENLRQLQDPGDLTGEELPPGPVCLRWVEGPSFTLVSSLVVVANIVFMVIESLFATNKLYISMKTQVFWIDHGFLVFYIVEIVLKWILWGSLLLCGRPCSAVWMNWLDVFIIGTAIIDQWILQVFFRAGSGGSLGLLRIFRLARLFRIVKICGLWMRADLSWAEGEKFNAFILGIIVVNCILMGVQVSFPTLWLWNYTENLVLSIFLFELVVRLRLNGCMFFANSNWIMNWLDFIIVVGGMIDLWLLPGINCIMTLMGRKTLDSGHLGPFISMLRMLRLVRLLRLIRLVRSIRQLYELLLGILQAMQGMFWLILLTVAVLYILALLGCKLIGRDGLMIGDSAPDDVYNVFPDVGRGMWALFMAMNGDASYMQPVLDAYPVSMIFCAAYMVFAGFAILSVLTGVVCDKMAHAAEEEAQKHAEEVEQLKKEEATAKLEHLFQKMDNDQSGQICRKEFEMMLDDEILAEELSEASEMETQDLMKIWETLSKSEKKINVITSIESISKKDWIDGILSAKQPASEFAIRRIEKELSDIKRTLSSASRSSFIT